MPLTPDARHDLDAMAAAVTDRTRVVIVCTPTTRPGPSVGAAELERFLDAVPRDVIVVLDEAYLEFVTAEDAPDCLALQRNRANVVVLRTFSKAYGLAGLRVGYAVADEAVATALRKTAIPFGVNSLAQAAAIASLDAADELLVRVKELVAERERVVAALREQGWEIPDTQANFVWFALGDETADFAAACERPGSPCGPTARTGCGRPSPSARRTTGSSRWPRHTGAGEPRRAGRHRSGRHPADRRRRPAGGSRRPSALQPPQGARLESAAPDPNGGVPMFVPFSIADFIDRAVAVYGDRVGVVDEPDQPAPSLGDLTYAEVAALAARQAARLDALGIGPG